ncbi:hypothetical protein RRG08_034933 [Elysia crispata]|uniref:Uncharacterized protein n=1 Tax=Elysia crispata TaxID=231223 RepID=A0AAE0Y3G5_9GAST|nr:hypothetical protein RRG08_034933 [Elysia crispata]
MAIIPLCPNSPGAGYSAVLTHSGQASDLIAFIKGSRFGRVLHSMSDIRLDEEGRVENGRGNQYTQPVVRSQFAEQWFLHNKRTRRTRVMASWWNETISVGISPLIEKRAAVQHVRSNNVPVPRSSDINNQRNWPRC